METIVTSIVLFCMAIMPLVIQGDHVRIKTLLDKLAAKDDYIEGIFQPSKNGYLGHGMSSLAYRGNLLKMGIEIAMKFFPKENEIYAENELRAYTILDAVNNTETEAMGIPTLYHYGKWNEYFMIGITLLDSEFTNKIKNNQLTSIDKLILFQETVRISKYFHNNGICHGDLHLKNIMFRLNKGFIIDFSLAIDTKKNTAVLNLCANKDWRQFLADIASTVDITYHWTDRKDLVNKFQNVEPEELRRVFCEFANTISNDAVLNYDGLSYTINEEIKHLNRHVPATVSWITPLEQLLDCLSINQNDSISLSGDSTAIHVV